MIFFFRNGHVYDLNKKIIANSGTLNYMAPEVVANLPYTYTADYWSFGIMFFEMLVGRVSFHALLL